MPGVTISCPRCKSTLRSGRPIPARQTIRCPKCGAVFEVPPQDNQPDSSVQAHPPSPVGGKTVERSHPNPAEEEKPRPGAVFSTGPSTAGSEFRPASPARDDQEAVVV